MKRNLKMIISSLLVSTSMLITTQSVFAIESIQFVPGIDGSLTKPYVEDSAEGKKAAAAKEAELRRWLKGESSKVFGEKKAPVRTRNQIGIQGYSEGKVVSIPVIAQETTYWCGPASALQILEYLKSGGVPSAYNSIAGITSQQGQLANDMGTTTSGTAATNLKNAMVKYHKLWYGYDYYVLSKVNTADSLFNIAQGAVNTGKSAELNVDTSKLSYYMGRAYDHFISMNGWSRDIDDYGNVVNRFIGVTDPHHNSSYRGYHVENINNVVNALQKWYNYGNVVW